MGSIGAAELVVVALIALMLVVPPLVVVVWLIKRSASTPAVPPGLVPCKACGNGVSPRAAACPRCGDPTGNAA